MGMFADSRENKEGHVTMPKTELHWMFNTNQTFILYDSEAPITTTTQKPPLGVR